VFPIRPGEPAREELIAALWEIRDCVTAISARTAAAKMLARLKETADAPKGGE
jgi:hypothetical protein